jgi:ABC-2 type transport system ATP-binding protein
MTVLTSTDPDRLRRASREDGPAISTHGLTKRYGRRTVVDGLDIEVPRGVVAGFVGPNGAGKTTTLRMLLGLVRPSAGEGRVLGRSLRDPASYLPRVGALIEGPAFYPSLTGERNLTVQAVLGGHDPARVPLVLDRVGLGERGADRYGSYSLGMKQRLGIAAALLGEPELLVLDEPTNGLDPGGIRDMRELVRSLADEGPTVLVSSHLLAEVEQVCDHLLVIEAGRRLFQGPTAALLAEREREVALGCACPDELSLLAELLERRGLSCRRAGDRLLVPASALLPAASAAGDGGAPATDAVRAALAELNRAAMSAGIALAELTVLGVSLEDRYQHLVSGGVR